MSAVIDSLTSGARTIASDVVAFATSPMGPFEAIDRIVRDVRSTGRNVMSAVGVNVPSMSGQRLGSRLSGGRGRLMGQRGAGPLQSVRRRLGM